MSPYFRLVHQQARQRALEAVKNAPEGFVVTVREPTRSSAANAAMWPILHAFATQLQWPVNGEMVWMSEEDWKDVLTAAYEREGRVARGLDGGYVMLGAKTREYGRSKFSGLLDFMHAAAVDKGVVVYPERVSEREMEAA